MSSQLLASRAIFPGSFDPLTKGHVDIAERALKFFDEIILGVLDNSEKDALFSVEERVALIEETFQGFKERVRVRSFSGLLVDFAKAEGVRVLVRGLRAISDYDYEAQLALMNRSLDNEIETFFLMTSEKYSYVSSSLVKQVARHGADIARYVPPAVEEALRSKSIDTIS